MPTPLPKHDRTLGVIADITQHTRTGGSKMPEVAKFIQEILLNEIDEITMNKITDPKLVKEGDFNTLPHFHEIREEIESVIASQMVAIVRNDMRFIRHKRKTHIAELELQDVSEVKWLIDSMIASLNDKNDPNQGKRKAYIASIIRDYCHNLIIVNATNREEIRTNNQAVISLTKYHSPEFTQKYFSHEIIREVLQKELGDESEKISEEELNKIFTPRVLIRFLRNVDPMASVIQTIKNYQVLTDEVIRDYLKDQDIEMSDDEIRTQYSRYRRMYISVHNIDNPLEAIGKSARIMKVTYINKNIQKHLKKRNIHISDEKLNEICPTSRRRSIANYMPTDPIEKIVNFIEAAIGLTDEVIQAALLKKGLWLTKEEIQEIYPPDVRYYFAAQYPENIMENLTKVAINYVLLFSDKSISEIFQSEGVKKSEEDIRREFKIKKRLEYAVHNIVEPEEKIRQLARNFKLMTPGNIREWLIKNKNMDVSESHIIEILGEEMGNICIDYPRRSIEAAGNVLYGYHTILTEEVLKKLMEQEEVLEEQKTVFAHHIRKRLIIKNPYKILDAARRYLKRLKALTHEFLKEKCKEMGIEKTDEEIKDIFNLSACTRLAASFSENTEAGICEAIRRKERPSNPSRNIMLMN